MSSGNARPRARITSASNPLIKMMKSLHTRKGRMDSGLFLCEGARAAMEAHALGVTPDVALFAPEAETRPQVRDLLTALEADGARCVSVPPALLTAISKRDNAQTVVAAYRQRLSRLQDLRCERLVIALQAVRDPGNLGTILRTADSVGADAVVLVDAGCDPFSVEAVRASMGSIFAVPVARSDFAAFNRWRVDQGLSMVGTSLNGRNGLDAIDAARPTVILMGNEQSGLPQAQEDACDALIRLPMRGRADSLNLAIATAVTAYEFWRRRGYDGARD